MYSVDLIQSLRQTCTSAIYASPLTVIQEISNNIYWNMSEKREACRAAKGTTWTVYFSLLSVSYLARSMMNGNWIAEVPF